MSKFDFSEQKPPLRWSAFCGSIPSVSVLLYKLTLYESLTAGGKPSTWLPPGGLVERLFESVEMVSGKQNLSQIAKIKNFEVIARTVPTALWQVKIRFRS